MDGFDRALNWIVFGAFVIRNRHIRKITDGILEGLAFYKKYKTHTLVVGLNTRQLIKLARAK